MGYRSDILLFDFNLKLGDMIKSSIGKGRTILAIDSLMNGRRIFHYDISYFTTSYFIEGIGTNGGLFSEGSHYFVLHLGEKANHLICYSENGELVYQSDLRFNTNCDIVNADHQFSLDTTAIWRIDTDISNTSGPWLRMKGFNILCRVIPLSILKAIINFIKQDTASFIAAPR